MSSFTKVLREIVTPHKVLQTRMLQKDRITESLRLLYDYFFKYENVCAANQITRNPMACDEIAKLAETIAEDGFSMIVTEKDTNKIVASFYNKPLTPQSKFFKNFRQNHCTQEPSKALLNVILEVDSHYDIFKLYNVDCYIDMIFLTVKKEYLNNGIASILIEDFLDYLISLENNNNYVNQPLPKVVACTLTSIYTYNIGKKLNFREVFRKGFDDFHVRGKYKLSDKVDCNLHSQGLAVMAKEVSEWKMEKSKSV